MSSRHIAAVKGRRRVLLRDLIAIARAKERGPLPLRRYRFCVAAKRVTQQCSGNSENCAHSSRPPPRAHLPATPR